MAVLVAFGTQLEWADGRRVAGGVVVLRCLGRMVCRSLDV